MCAVPNMAVFCSSLTSCFPGMLLTYFLNDFEIAPVAHIITDITFVFTFHMRFISIVRSLYFTILCFRRLQRLLTYMFPFHYHELWCLLLLFLLLITFMHGIYNYISETNRVCSVYSVAAVLYLQLVLHVMLLPILKVLYFYISTFHSMCAVFRVAVFFVGTWFRVFQVCLFRYLRNDFEIVPVAPLLLFHFHMRWISIVRSLYIRIF